MNAIQFNIQQLYALSAGLEKPEDWAAWFEQKQTPASLEIPTQAIPAMMRRRMSNLSKLAVQVAALLSKSESIDFIVFSSQHGELPRTITLLLDILAGRDASPTAFSMSVHNTASGLFTIATQNAVPATSIAGGADSFHYAFIEAAAYLAQYPNNTVLVVHFDAPLPPPYCVFENVQTPPYALGLVLRAGCDLQMSFQAVSDKVSPSDLSKNRYPHALQWYAHWLDEKDHFSITSTQKKWCWEKYVFAKEINTK